MFRLSPLIFCIVSLLVFRPIWGETERNVTEPIKIPILEPIDIKNVTKDVIKNESKEVIIKPLKNILVSDNGTVKEENRTKPEINNKPSITKPVIELENTQTHLDNNKTTKSIETNSTSASSMHVTVGRKGVSNESTIKPSNITSLPVNITTEKPSSTTVPTKPKKPTVTIRGDDEGQIEQKSKNGSSDKFPSIEYFQRHKEQINKADFVIPIVAVILSVPVVAIVINILYKRGKEWWSHRHYRRMDFLIDGMYNN
ncbi:uncharacterized protein [Onthophagus taurus]|uniref:uncharacterized protein n=1 Tax=Onthophagus taurus TaxID=166361 RepID=UPI0039BE42A3